MNSTKSPRSVGEQEHAQFDDDTTVQQPGIDELSLVKLYIELSGSSEAEARSVVMFLMFREARN